MSEAKTLVCSHGSLRRQCYTCDLEDQVSAAQATIEEQRETMRKLISQDHSLCRMKEDEACAEIAVLKAAFNKYGFHKLECVALVATLNIFKCNCGFDAALNGEVKP